MNRLQLESFNKLAAETSEPSPREQATTYVVNRLNTPAIAATSLGVGTIGGGLWRGLSRGGKIGFGRAFTEGAGLGALSGGTTGATLTYGVHRLKNQYPETKTASTPSKDDAIKSLGRIAAIEEIKKNPKITHKMDAYNKYKKDYENNPKLRSGVNNFANEAYNKILEQK